LPFAFLLLPYYANCAALYPLAFTLYPFIILYLLFQIDKNQIHLIKI